MRKIFNSDSLYDRRKFVKAAKLPKKREEIDLPKECKQLPNKERFLLYDDKKNGIMIFGSLENLERLKKCTKVYRSVHVSTKQLYQ